MEDKRLDFDTPFLSVRRFSAPTAADSSTASNAGESDRTAGRPPPRRSSLPFYKSELKSGPVRNPGVVPFVWEQTPGQPKGGPPGSGGPRARPLGRPPASPKLPLGTESDASRGPGAAKLVTSVRTHKPISVSSNGGIPISSESSGGGVRKLRDEDVKQQSMQVDSSDEDDDAFSDAVDTLSCTDSVFMNCSMSGLSGALDAVEPSGSYATDPQVRDFMMGRFLPASVAASSPQCAPRRPPIPRREPTRSVEREHNGDYRHPLPPSYRYGPNVLQYAREQEEEGDSYVDEEDYDGTSHLSSKACGLLPQFLLKSSFCLLNPISRMKVQRLQPPPHGGRISSPQIKTSHHKSLHQAEDEHSWEAVYMHKSGHGDQHLGESGSKLASESNHLTYSSDSQTPDGSSPYRRSIAGSISPYRNEAPRSPFREGKGFLGLPKRRMKIWTTNDSDSCEKDVEDYSEIIPCDDSQQGSGSMSPVTEKTLHVDTVHTLETPDSKSSSVNTNSELKGVRRPAVIDSDVGVVSRIMEDSLALETRHIDTSQPKVSELVEPGLPLCSERSDYGDIADDNSFKRNDSGDGPLPLKVENQVKNDAKNDASFLPLLLPPPLPRSPSESWLSRKLPFVSSRNPSQQSFLGIQVQHRKQVLRASTPKRETGGKLVKAPRQIRFADMLTKPLSPESEM